MLINKLELTTISHIQYLNLGDFFKRQIIVRDNGIAETKSVKC